MKRVAIQGVEGAFHEIAARHYFNTEKIEIIPCHTFPELFSTVKNGEADFAIMAIENVIAGSILLNYNLLREHNFQIYGELMLRIRQNLMALPGQSIEEISEVHSHHMAIAQTRQFFRQYPHIKLIESVDTAISARNISEHKSLGVGAIAGKYAAEKYGLEVLEESIETFKKNQTRFLIISEPGTKELSANPDKASIYFEVAHNSGCLSQVLSIMAFYNLNLTKIQSMPIMDSEWEYTFYVDLSFEDHVKYRQAISAIRPLTHNLSIMGEYNSGRKITDDRLKLHNQTLINQL